MDPNNQDSQNNQGGVGANPGIAERPAPVGAGTPVQPTVQLVDKIVAYDNIYIVVDTNDGREEQAEAILSDLGMNR